ncbi:hypothetical protein PAQ31011_01344 [Pandoraea aquatica]|uniref:Uncharacterized protein n=1 Tax=Pandoraea aquatica TaxID=2508290 RepID=A0A5E4TC43_9BURK|nr:hypothetical protein [Pandoraea aquatica]VVD85485.1 hypothetical protein PAQ31011_01344 [Pandoraea aquatica]
MLFDSSLLLGRAPDPDASVLAVESGAGQTLESRFMNAVANLSADFEGDRAGIKAAASRFDPTDAASGIELQNRLAVYPGGVH